MSSTAAPPTRASSPDVAHGKQPPGSDFLFIGTHPSEAAARADSDVVKDLHSAGTVGTYDAAVVTKDDAGKVHVNKDEMATRHGAWAVPRSVPSSASGSRLRSSARPWSARPWAA
jgi:hypothetical protein